MVNYLLRASPAQCFFYAVISAFWSPVGLRRSPGTGPEPGRLLLANGGEGSAFRSLVGTRRGVGLPRPRDACIALHFARVAAGARPWRTGQLLLFVRARLQPVQDFVASRRRSCPRRGAACPARAMRHASRTALFVAHLGAP